MYKIFGKRLFDFFVSLNLLIVLSPLMFFLSIIIFFNIKKNPIFIQQRVGLNNQIFFIYKFKTMSDERDSMGKLLPDKDRLTNFGRSLRKLSLDELPQLYNVLSGEMSLVGPRPLLVSYLSLYTPEQAFRHTVRPGLTGLAQVNGRNTLDWDSKFALDVFYARNITFFLDIKILLMTVLKVLYRDGISSVTSDTMESFKGGSSQKIN